MVVLLLLYQDHYSEAVVENFYEKKVLSESESIRITWEQAAGKELPAIAGQTIFQNKTGQRPFVLSSLLMLLMLLSYINIVIKYYCYKSFL